MSLFKLFRVFFEKFFIYKYVKSNFLDRSFYEFKIIGSSIFFMENGVRVIAGILVCCWLIQELQAFEEFYKSFGFVVIKFCLKQQKLFVKQKEFFRGLVYKKIRVEQFRLLFDIRDLVGSVFCIFFIFFSVRFILGFSRVQFENFWFILFLFLLYE